MRPFDPDRDCCDHLFYRSMSFNLFAVTRPELDTPPPGSRLFVVYREPAYAWLDPRNGLGRQPPFAYRIVTPLLARGVAIAVGIDAAYYLVSFLALAGAAYFVGLSIFELTGSLIPAVAGVIVFLVNPFTAPLQPVGLHAHRPDGVLARRARDLGAGEAQARCCSSRLARVGVLNKESMLPMLAAYPLQ